MMYFVIYAYQVLALTNTKSIEQNNVESATLHTRRSEVDCEGSMDVSRVSEFRGTPRPLHSRIRIDENSARATTTEEKREEKFCGFSRADHSHSTSQVWRDYIALHKRERGKHCFGRYLVWACK